MPPQGIRTFLSFLLFVHLFALLTAIASTAAPVSALRAQLGEIPGLKHYLQLLHMNLAYNFHLTDASSLDTKQWLELEVDFSGDGETPADKTVVLPEPGTRFGLRAQHYRSLALAGAQLLGDEQGDEAVESLLPLAIARKLLAEQGLTTGKHRIRVRRQELLSMNEVGSIDPAESDPANPRRQITSYEALVTFYRNRQTGRDEIVLTRAASALETAPVENRGR